MQICITDGYSTVRKEEMTELIKLKDSRLQIEMRISRTFLLETDRAHFNRRKGVEVT